MLFNNYWFFANQPVPVMIADKSTFSRWGYCKIKDGQPCIELPAGTLIPGTSLIFDTRSTGIEKSSARLFYQCHFSGHYNLIRFQPVHIHTA